VIFKKCNLITTTKILRRSSWMRCSNKSGDPESRSYKSSIQEAAVEQTNFARWLTSGPQDSKMAL
jgi:hypothetical protein